MINTENDKVEIQDLHLQAFGDEEGPVIEKMTEEFLLLPETISINVYRGLRIAGNILFSPFQLDDHPEKKCFLLAPLGVLPEHQGTGIGKELIEKGVYHLKLIGADAIFVLGHPSYYASRGFVQAKVLSPHHELMKHPEAWRMLEVKPGSMEGIAGTSVAAEPIMDPMFWDTSGRPG
ncbi:MULTISPECIES: GNAT family N-acetyltransferase [unclassified Pseudovibrio]|uniref:GNAT family N-acetyltransferase n=1 Tax=unclassified Pseudovibrio TaxID=2627060 RepID=UPI0007AE6AF8|nr:MULTISPECIES: N-acetyltransferase [unclassified Pseudovibrio]KZL26277.1 Acetyltransferase (GNAT) family protein [Pseudovibrio sp. Ad37]KZL28359.1 Acetyltransferase (GNAT) family protein [Pseudovibrio sp. WM33]